MRTTASTSTAAFIRLLLECLVFIALPLAVMLAFFVAKYHEDLLGVDFMHFMLPAARAVADGNSPYPDYEYPPLVAFALVPFTFIPGPNIVLAVILIACVPASMWFLGVRDWRCYGLVFLWAPTLAAVQTSNVTIPLLLGTAICWHARDRWKPTAVAGGLTIAAKLLTAPLVIWLAATRRFAACGRCRRRRGGRVARPLVGDRFLGCRRLSQPHRIDRTARRPSRATRSRSCWRTCGFSSGGGAPRVGRRWRWRSSRVQRCSVGEATTVARSHWPSRR